MCAALAGSLAAEPLPGQIVVSEATPRFLARHEQGPVFLCGPGDPEGFFYRGVLLPDGTRDGDQAEIIAKLAASGANTLYVIAVRSHGGDGDPTQNPFVGHDPAQGLDDDVLDSWESWLTALDDAGVVTFFILYDDTARIWDTGGEVGAAERSFLRGIVNRFEHHLGLIWCVAEEYSETLSQERVSRIAAEIRAADDHAHPIAVHQVEGLNFDFADDPSIDQFAAQYNAADGSVLHDALAGAFDRAAGRFGLMMAEATAWGTGAEGRRKAWACAMAGAYVMILGMDVASTPPGDLLGCRRLIDFFESTSFATMEPHDELAFAGTRWVLARPGEEYILYSDEPAGGMGVRGLPDSEWALLWYDAASGNVLGAPLLAGRGDLVWAIPTGLGQEVALHLRRVQSTSVTEETWARLKGRYRGSQRAVPRVKLP
jgi:hypothetical protein